jgi:hypothetical protein
MSALSFLDECEFWYWQSFRSRFYINDINTEIVTNYTNAMNINKPMNRVTVGAWNLNSFSNGKFAALVQFIETYNLDLVWVIDIRRKLPLIAGYTIVYDSDPLINALVIRNSLYFNSKVVSIDFGISFAGINFRYLHPDLTTQILNYGKEIGDYNLLSNKWVKFDLTCESRNGKPGGMATNLENVKIFEMPLSDHNFILAETDFDWTPIYDVNYFDLEYSINEAINTKTWKLKKSRKDINKVEYDIKFTENPKSKIIKNAQLNIDPWKILYAHDPNKYDSWQLHIGPILNDASVSISKAKDINYIPTKWAMEIYNKLNTKQKSNLLIAWKNLSRQTKAIMLRKKNKSVNSVLDVRLIQIYPIHLKILENSRIALRTWLENNMDQRFYGFVKNKSATMMMKDLMGNI